MDTAQENAPIESQEAQNVSQPSSENDIAPPQPLSDDIASSLKGYDIKGADLSSMGLDPLAGKYKNVGELEKAYTNLQSRFGSFTGAPEEYEIPDGAEVGDWFKEWGRENNLSQDGFSTLIEKFNERQAERAETYYKEEMAKLGSNVEERLNSLKDWGAANNIPPETMESLFQSADAVQALEALRSGASVQAPANTDANQPALTKEYLNEITNAVDANGRKKVESNPEYAKWVQEQWMKAVG